MTDICGRYEAKAPRNMFNIQAVGGKNASHCNYTVGGTCGDWDFITNDGRLHSSNKIASLVATYLSIRALIKNECEQHYSGGWWADSFRTDNVKSGSKLFELNSKQASQATLALAKNYALIALSPLAKAINAKIEVTAKLSTNRLVTLTVHVKGLNNSMTGNYLDNGWLWKNNEV